MDQCTFPRLVTSREAAERLGVSQRTFKQWVDKGLMPARIAGTYKWDWEVISRSLDKRSGIGREQSHG